MRKLSRLAGAARGDSACLGDSRGVFIPDGPKDLLREGSDRVTRSGCAAPNGECGCSCRGDELEEGG